MNHSARRRIIRASHPPATGKAAALLATLMSLIVVTSPMLMATFVTQGSSTAVLTCTE